MGKAGLHVVPLTAEELMWLHGLSVEEGLRRGYCIVGHVKEWKEARRAALAQERQALGGRRREWDYLDRPKKPKKPKKPQPFNPDDNRVPPPGEWRQILPKNTPENTTKHVGRVSETRENTSDAIRNTSQTQTEGFTNMDKNTRILLLIHMMSSESFAAMPQTEKAILLTELLYGKDKPEPAAAPKQPKHPGGRPKKDATAADEKAEGDEG